MAQLDTQQTGTTICPPQGTWVIDPVHSTIEFSVRHLMAAKVRGHFTQYTGRIDIAEDHVRLEVTLPWLLAKFAEKLTPAIRKEATLMLEKK